MYMKKRSQSSLRAKTLQSEADPNEPNHWIGNFQSTKSRAKYSQNIASSMIEEANKQNTESNIQACRSVQELSDRSDIVNRTPTTYKNTNMKKDQYGLQVTPHSHLIKVETSEIQQDAHQQYHSGPFNYVQQYYEVQIQSLNNKITQMSTELKKYRELYSSKQCQLEDLSEGISTRISKQNNEKNVLIKQINSNNIQIKRLKEEINLHKSEKQTLKIVLKQKETVIEELNNSIVQVEYKKKKVEGYQMQLRESHSAIHEIQLQMNKLKSEAEKKDLIISNSNKKIANLENKLLQYQEDIKELERCTIALKENTSSSHNKVEFAQRQCQEWKNKYCQVKLQLEQIPELQAKLRSVQVSMEEMQAKMKQMFVANEKLKIDLVNYQSLRNKNLQLEKQLSSLKNLIRQKCEELEATENSAKMLQKIQEELEFYRNRLVLVQREIQEKDQEIRLSKMRIQEKELKINSLNEQLEQISKQSIRIKELQSKIDTLFTENEKLHSSLLEKINEIQDLQRKINILQSKQITMTNQCTKLKAMYEGITQQLSESESKFENMKSRWESELGAKMGLEEKCTRLSKETVGLRTQIMSLEENNKNLTQKSEQLATEFEQKKLELYLQLDQLNNYKIQAETQLLMSQKKTQQLRLNVSSLKSEISQNIQKQTSQMLRIRQFETKMIILQDQLNYYKDQSEKIRKHWIQVQEISTLALMQYK